MSRGEYVNAQGYTGRGWNLGVGEARAAKSWCCCEETRKFVIDVGGQSRVPARGDGMGLAEVRSRLTPHSTSHQLLSSTSKVEWKYLKGNDTFDHRS